MRTGMEQGAAVPFGDQLNLIARLADPNEQWNALSQIGQPEGLSLPAYATALLDAAASERFASYAVRACMLEQAVYKVCAASQTGRDTSPETAKLHEVIAANLPEYTARWNGGVPSATPGVPETALHQVIYHQMFEVIAGSEGFTGGMENRHTAHPMPGGLPARVPLAGMMLLDRMIGGRDAWFHSTEMVVNVAHRLPQALDFRGAVFQATTNMSSHDRLSRLTRAYSPEYQHITELLAAQPPAEQRAYADAFNRLYEAAPGLSEVFFSMDQRLITNGVRRLLADALFAVEAYIEGGHVIDADFSWPDSDKLIHIHEEDPVGTLHALARAMEILTLTQFNPATRVWLSAQNKDFSQYILHDPTTSAQPRVGLHLRPYRDDTHDPTYEFTPDQTVRWRVALGPGPIDLRNAHQTPDTVSIRVDLDARGAALDVGALMPNPFMNESDRERDIERRIGLLLAFGNWRRSQAAAIHPTMNHVRDLDRRYGDEDSFGLAVAEMGAAMLESEAYRDAGLIGPTHLGAAALELLGTRDEPVQTSGENSRRSARSR